MWGTMMRHLPVTALMVLFGAVSTPASVWADSIGGKTETPAQQTIETTPAPGKADTPGVAGPGRTLPGLPWSLPGMPGMTAIPTVPGPPTPAVMQKPVKPVPMPPPIAFFVAKGEPPACGRDCAEWIAADGLFDSDAPQRLRALLNRLGKRKLPIYFHSPGGSVAAALAIGRLMRERGLTAGVAWTVPQGCDPKEPREPACDKLKRSGRELPAQLETSRTMCNSACVYALVGAAVRDVGLGANLGIHSTAVRFVNSHTHAAIKPPQQVVRATLNAGYERLASYFRDMGIDPALVRAAREIENDRVRLLTRAEIRRFNIDRRAFVESNWKFAEEPARSISKNFVSESKRRDGPDLRGLVRLSCSTSDRLRLELTRVRASGEEIDAAPLFVSAGASMQNLYPARRASLTTSAYDVTTAQVSPSFLLDAGDAIAITAASGTSEAKTADPAIKLSTAGLAPALGKLLPLCGIAPAALKADGAASARP